jgi:hypothetical protein
MIRHFNRKRQRKRCLFLAAQDSHATDGYKISNPENEWTEKQIERVLPIPRRHTINAARYNQTGQLLIYLF